MSEAASRLSASARLREQVAGSRQATARTNPCSSSLYGCLVNSEGFKIWVVGTGGVTLAWPALTQMSNLLRNELLAFTFEHFSLVAVLSGRISLSEDNTTQASDNARRTPPAKSSPLEEGVNFSLFLANCFVPLSNRSP